MSKALQVIAPAWHAEAAEMLNANFTQIHTAFTDATTRAVWMGMFLNFIKQKGKEDGSIPHGQFLPWLEKNVPDVPSRTIRTYMQLADGVCEKNEFQIGQFSQFAELPGQLPAPIAKAIEGKTQQQLFFEFKHVDDTGAPRKAGCAPGQRRAIPLNEQAELMRAAAAADWLALEKSLLHYADHFTLLGDAEVDVQIGVLERVLKARKDWLKQPKDRRNSAAIAELFQS